MQIYQHYTPLGLLLLASKDNHFVKIWFSDQSVQNQNSYPPLPDQYATELNDYFKGKPTKFDWPIKLEGTDFQIKVWQQILTIPYGKTTTYKEIAAKIRTKGYQAVGTSVGANNLAIIVPCHRVLGSGNFGGYSYGLPIKRFLLELENAIPRTDLC